MKSTHCDITYQDKSKTCIQMSADSIFTERNILLGGITPSPATATAMHKAFTNIENNISIKGIRIMGKGPTQEINRLKMLLVMAEDLARDPLYSKKMILEKEKIATKLRALAAEVADNTLDLIRDSSGKKISTIYPKPLDEKAEHALAKALTKKEIPSNVTICGSSSAQKNYNRWLTAKALLSPTFDDKETADIIEQELSLASEVFQHYEKQQKKETSILQTVSLFSLPFPSPSSSSSYLSPTSLSSTLPPPLLNYDTVAPPRSSTRRKTKR